MSLLAQEVVEKAGSELSRCIVGLGLKTKKYRDDKNTKMASSVKRGGVMEKVANVFCGNNNAAAAGGGTFHGGNKVSKLDGGKPVPPEKPSRFLIGKVRNGGVPFLSAASTASTASQCHGSPRPSPRPQRPPPKAHRAYLHRPTSWQGLIKDEHFLSGLFLYLAPIERTVLAQVCVKWRDVLYQPRFWRGVRPVLKCRQLRRSAAGRDGDDETADLRRRFYISVQTRGFDSLVLTEASDEDLLDLVSNFAVNRTTVLRAVSLRCSSVSDKGLETLLDHLNSVTKLELQGCNELTEAGLWACLNTRIVSLSIFDCINIADEAVGAVAQLLPALCELNLQAYHVTDAALAYFSPRQTNTLTVLRLQSCWELTNHSIVNLVHALPHVTVLSLSGCSKITDDGVELIAENLRKLRSLDLSWCPRITDASLEYIACDLNQLERLTLDRCSLISDIGIGYVSTMLLLNSLFLRWCAQVRDFGVQHLASMRNLQVLSLAGCGLVTSSGLSALVELRNLQELELTNCAGATPELYHHLSSQLPKCLIIE